MNKNVFDYLLDSRSGSAVAESLVFVLISKNSCT